MFNSPFITIHYSFQFIWHSDDTRVGVWPGTGTGQSPRPGNITVHSQTLGAVSNGFQFETRMTEARNAWTTALNISGLSINNHTVASTANIRAFGGSRAEMQRESGDFGNNWGGLAHIRFNTASIGTITVGNRVSTVHNLVNQNRMFVVERSDASTWTQDNINRTRKTTTHELGHVLGYFGHPPRIAANDQDVMWYTNTPHFTIRQNEGRHLRQAYGNFR